MNIKKIFTKKLFASFLITAYFLGGAYLYLQNKELKQEITQYKNKPDQLKTKENKEYEDSTTERPHIVDIPARYFDPDEIFEYGNTSTLLGVDVNLPPVAIEISAKGVQLFDEELDLRVVNPSSFTDINKDGYHERDYHYGDPIDVDNDGIKEDVISVETVVMNHGAADLIIVKNNRIIFKSGIVAGNIKPSKSNNGFYLNEMIDSGTLLGVGGGRTTRYIYEQGKFIPVWYQNHFDLQTTKK